MFDENLRFWQEYDLLIRLAQKCPFLLEEPLVVNRLDPYSKGRLSNKYSEWLHSASYVYKKHQPLYASLNFHKKLRVKMLFHRDARNKALRGGLRCTHLTHAVCYRLLRLLIKSIEKKDIAQCRKFARENTWKDRVGRIVQELEKLTQPVYDRKK